MANEFECTAFHHRYSRQERFQCWRERLGTRIWRRCHPRQAKEKDEAQAEAWRRITPALTTCAVRLFNPSPDVVAASERYERIRVEPDNGDWYWDPPAPSPQSWHRRLRWRVSGWLWRIIEAL